MFREKLVLICEQQNINVDLTDYVVLKEFYR